MAEDNDNQTPPLDVDFGSALVERLEQLHQSETRRLVVEGEETLPRMRIAIVMPDMGLSARTAAMVLQLAEHTHQNMAIDVVRFSDPQGRLMDVPMDHVSSPEDLMAEVQELLERNAADMADFLLVPDETYQDMVVAGGMYPRGPADLMEIVCRKKPYMDDGLYRLPRMERTKDWESRKPQRMGGKKRKKGRK